MDICTRRLTKELKALKKDPIVDPKITVMPNERNLREIHYVLEGSRGTVYEGGVYHGKLVFPKEYPLKAPSVLMITPNGRFQTNRRLCLSMSDFHPESWNPMWSVSTILTGLYSFMLENNPTLGSVETSARTKRQLASSSLEWNVLNDETFGKLFPEYVQRYHELKRAAASEALTSSSSSSSSPHDNDGPGPGGAVAHAFEHGNHLPQGVLATFAGLLAILSIVVVYRFS